MTATTSNKHLKINYGLFGSVTIILIEYPLLTTPIMRSWRVVQILTQREAA